MEGEETLPGHSPLFTLHPPLSTLHPPPLVKSAIHPSRLILPLLARAGQAAGGEGAAGALEAIVCVQTLQHDLIHPTINYETPDPECDLDYTPNKAR